MLKIFLLFLILLSTLSISAERDSCLKVLLVEKGEEIIMKDDMISFSESGFYLYKNCVYDISTNDGERLGGRLIDVKPDTLLFSNYFNEEVAKKNSGELDTIALYYKNISKLHLLVHRDLEEYIDYDLEGFEFRFIRDTTDCIIPSKYIKVYDNYPQEFEIIPYLTAIGAKDYYEFDGEILLFTRIHTKEPINTIPDDSIEVRHFLWFTPCYADTINGLAIGIFPVNIRNVPPDELTINGINIVASPIDLFFIMMFPYYLKYPNREEISMWAAEKIENRTYINGNNFSLIGTYAPMISIVRGLNVTGVMTALDRMEGLSFSGLSNFIISMEGLSVAMLYNGAVFAEGVQIGAYNKAGYMRGLQIGIWNSSENFKGIQLGLWNVIDGKGLPIINMRF